MHAWPSGRPHRRNGSESSDTVSVRFALLEYKSPPAHAAAWQSMLMYSTSDCTGAPVPATQSSGAPITNDFAEKMLPGMGEKTGYVKCMSQIGLDTSSVCGCIRTGFYGEDIKGGSCVNGDGDIFWSYPYSTSIQDSAGVVPDPTIDTKRTIHSYHYDCTFDPGMSGGMIAFVIILVIVGIPCVALVVLFALKCVLRYAGATTPT